VRKKKKKKGGKEEKALGKGKIHSRDKKRNLKRRFLIRKRGTGGDWGKKA